MTTKQLKSLLSDMADEVTPVPMHQRAVARSKSIATRKVAVASVVAFVLVGGSVVGGTVAADKLGYLDGRPGMGAAADKELPTSDVSKLDGTFYEGYFNMGHGEGLRSWNPGDDKADDVIAVGSDGGSYFHTASVSPDGTNVAYMTQSKVNYSTNQIKIRNLTTGEITEISQHSGPAKTCSEPTWAPNGDRVFVDRGSEFGERTGFIDVASGEFTPFAVDDPCDVRVTGNGHVYSTAETDGTVDVMITDEDAKTRPVSAVAEVAHKYDVYIRELVAVSPDGRFVCVNTNTEPDGYDDTMGNRFNVCDLLVDTETKLGIKPFDPRHDNDSVVGSPSMFAIPGRLVAERAAGGDTKQQLYDYRGRLIDEVASATTDENEQILGFVPQ